MQRLARRDADLGRVALERMLRDEPDPPLLRAGSCVLDLNRVGRSPGSGCVVAHSCYRHGRDDSSREEDGERNPPLPVVSCLHYTDSGSGKTHTGMPPTVVT